MASHDYMFLCCVADGTGNPGSEELNTLLFIIDFVSKQVTTDALQKDIENWICWNSIFKI